MSLKVVTDNPLLRLLSALATVVFLALFAVKEITDLFRGTPSLLGEVCVGLFLFFGLCYYLIRILSDVEVALKSHLFQRLFTAIKQSAENTKLRQRRLLARLVTPITLTIRILLEFAFYSLRVFIQFLTIPFRDANRAFKDLMTVGKQGFKFGGYAWCFACLILGPAAYNLDSSFLDDRRRHYVPPPAIHASFDPLYGTRSNLPADTPNWRDDPTYKATSRSLKTRKEQRLNAFASKVEYLARK